MSSDSVGYRFRNKSDWFDRNKFQSQTFTRALATSPEICHWWFEHFRSEPSVAGIKNKTDKTKTPETALLQVFSNHWLRKQSWILLSNYIWNSDVYSIQLRCNYTISMNSSIISQIHWVTFVIPELRFNCEACSLPLTFSLSLYLSLSF